MGRLRVAVLISGRGSNLAALIAAARQPDYPAEIALVLSNKPDAGGLALATEAGIATAVVPHLGRSRTDFDAAVEAELAKARIELIALAGFMRIFTPELVRRWSGRMLNIHPSLLPAFPGLDIHARVLAAGVKLGGCTVHFVTEELDGGPIIGQAAVPVLADDTEATLGARVLAAEHRLYPACLALVAKGQTRLDGNRVVLPGGTLADGLLANPRA